MRVIASSGSTLVAYHGYGSDKIRNQQGILKINRSGKWDAEIDLSGLLENALAKGEEKKIQFFYLFTTTLISLKLNREPLPLVSKNNVFWFIEHKKR